MPRLARFLAWISVSGALVGFFVPWARLDLREPEAVRQLREAAQGQGLLDGLTKKVGRVAVEIRRGAETVTGELPSLSDIPKEVSGAQIPQLANQSHAKTAVALLELFTNTRQQIGLKSYAVYLIPGVALLCGVGLTCWGRRRRLMIGIGLLCAGIAGAGFWKLLTTDTRALFIAITIGPGLWMSLWAYVGLAVAALLALIARPRPN